MRLQLHALAYNTGNFLRTLALLDEIEYWSMTTLRENLIKIGAKVVRHGRYVTFQLAEVAIPLPLFAEFLQLIAGLRPRPAARTNDQATDMPFVCRSDRLILGDRAAVGKPCPTWSGEVP